MIEELKPCPFCGGKARIVRKTCSNKINPVTIMDEWTVECDKKCCSIKRFSDEIFHDDSGEVIIRKNGAKDAVYFWNKRL